MQQREKILAMVLGAVVVYWFGAPIFTGYFIDPIRDLENLQASRQQESMLKMDQQIELIRQGKALEEWEKISLPPDPRNAHRLYQAWLTDLALMSGFEEVKPTLEPISPQKDKIFNRVPVKITATARLQELALFLERFESVNLKHRISSCKIVSAYSEGDPPLKVEVVAEGLSIQSAPERNDLFPQLEIEEPLDREANLISVNVVPKEFPQEAPFRVRIGDEFMNVTAMNGDEWTLQRGVARTFSADHTAGSRLELFPLVADPDATQRQVQKMWSESLFTKPNPFVKYEPRLAVEKIPPAIRGETYKYHLEVAPTEWNPAFGEPRYTLLETPEGMSINERTGDITWPVPEDMDVNEIRLEAIVWGSASKDEGGFTETLLLRVRDPNLPPRVEEQQDLKFFLGRETRVTIAATDPDGEDSQLKFRLEEPPTGMIIGESDGVIRWTPPESLDPQAMSVRVTITDGDELPQSTTVTLPVSVEEDSARFAFLTASFTKTIGEDHVVKEAWIFDRATNKKTTLHEGEQFTIADFELTVAEIGPDYVKLRRGGDTYQLNFAVPLVAMTKLEQPNQDYNPAPVEESEEPDPDVETDTNNSTSGTSSTQSEDGENPVSVTAK